MVGSFVCILIHQQNLTDRNLFLIYCLMILIMENSISKKVQHHNNEQDEDTRGMVFEAVCSVPASLFQNWQKDLSSNC